MVVKQLPIIEEHLREKAEEVKTRTELACSMACTPDTVTQVKKIRDKLDKEILELETRHDTTYATCERLAWLYIVRDHITGQQAAQPTPLSADPSSEFLQAVDGKDSVAIFDIIDDLMDTLKVVAPRVYASVLEKIKRV